MKSLREIRMLIESELEFELDKEADSGYVKENLVEDIVNRLNEKADYYKVGKYDIFGVVCNNPYLSIDILERLSIDPYCEDVREIANKKLKGMGSDKREYLNSLYPPRNLHKEPENDILNELVVERVYKPERVYKSIEAKENDSFFWNHIRTMSEKEFARMISLPMSNEKRDNYIFCRVTK